MKKMPLVIASSAQMRHNPQAIGSMSNPTSEDLLSRVSALENALGQFIIKNNSQMDDLIKEVKKKGKMSEPIPPIPSNQIMGVRKRI